MKKRSITGTGKSKEMIANQYGPSMKLQYRSGLRISIDVLDVCMNAGFEGALISAISRKANLSHYAAFENCKRLVHAGMIRQVRTRKRNIFVITEKGMLLFREFQRFCDTMKELNIRY